ncbi:MAG TPA: YkgJ family cysteine cluster protein [Candidatus Nanoarchaeia archaeon]|nr:YkgJ family cysteine cluster protein [Candidatus Nanoarchaeia archaeon]
MSFTYPKNIWFVCSKCGLCCGDTQKKTRHVLLLKQEVKRIADQTQQPVNSFAKEASGNAPYLFEMKKNPDSSMCIFLKDNVCSIYDNRPLVCRFYPFELSTTEKGEFVFKETDECPSLSCLEFKNAKKLGFPFFAALFELACAELG